MLITIEMYPLTVLEAASPNEGVGRAPFPPSAQGRTLPVSLASGGFHPPVQPLVAAHHSDPVTFSPACVMCLNLPLFSPTVPPVTGFRATNPV